MVDYSAVECFTYSDVQKAFSFNAGLGTLFTTKMSRKSRDIKYKSIYLARLIGTSFDVVFEPNVNGFLSQIYTMKMLKSLKVILVGKKRWKHGWAVFYKYAILYKTNYLWKICVFSY